MRLPSRRIFWFSAASLLVTVVAWAWFFMPRSRITRENFERIREGMTKEEITAFLGDEMPPLGSDSGFSRFSLTWTNGPDWINVSFDNRKAYDKSIHIASVWETVQYYVRRALRKLGVEDK